MQYRPRTRPATTLVELLLFLAFFALSSGVLLAFFFMTSEQRVRQQTISTVEQSGVQLMQTLSNRIRNSERVLDPLAGSSGSILALQLSDSGLHPTILSLSGSVLYVTEANSIRTLSSESVRISDLNIFNTSVAEDRATVLLRFTVSRSVPLSVPLHYSRTFEALVELFPDDQPGVSCSCPSPGCSAGDYVWQYCVDSTCTDPTVSLSCT